MYDLKLISERFLTPFSANKFCQAFEPSSFNLSQFQLAHLVQRLIPLFNVPFPSRLKTTAGLPRLFFSQSNPISQRHCIISECILWLVHTLSLFTISQMTNVFCHIYLWLPQHSEFIICKFGQQRAFSPPKKTHGSGLMEDIHRASGPNDRPRIGHLLICCRSLTSSLEGHC